MKRLCLVSIFVFWLLLLFFDTGLFSSGFHLIDDHRLVAIQADLSAPRANILTVLRDWAFANRDENRLRPLYWASRVLRTEIFGLHWPAWMFYNAFLAAATSAGLFLLGSAIGLTILSSYAAAALATLGQPSTIWWRLGTPETEANFLIVLALLFLAKAVADRKRQVSCDLAAIALATLASLEKEGMILYLAAVCAFRIWLPGWLRNEKLIPALRDSRLVIVSLAAVAVAELTYLVEAVGIAGTGYAGVGRETFDFAKLRSNLAGLVSVGILWLPAAATVLAAGARAIARPARPSSLAPLGLAWAVFLLAAIPQVLLYTKSGWQEHYFNPVILNCAILVLCAVDSLRRIHPWIYVAFLIVVLAQIPPRFRWTRLHAKEYAADGLSLRQMLDSTADCAAPDEKVLLVLNPRAHYEEALSLRTYLTRRFATQGVFLATVGAEGAQIASSAFEAREKARRFLDPRWLEEHFFQGQTLERMDGAEREKIRAVLMFAPDRLRGDFAAGSADWFRPERYRTEHFTFPAFGVELWCRR